MTNSKRTLIKHILEETGQDLRKCRGCLACDLYIPAELSDSFSRIIQLIIENDQELLSSPVIWDERLFVLSRSACNKQFNLQKVILSLRKIGANAIGHRSMG